jgi:hypothetical protein
MIYLPHSNLYIKKRICLPYQVQPNILKPCEVNAFRDNCQAPVETECGMFLNIFYEGIHY